MLASVQEIAQVSLKNLPIRTLKKINFTDGKECLAVSTKNVSVEGPNGMCIQRNNMISEFLT